MNCPNCGHEINPAAILGAKGGRATGASKVRAVNYSAIARKSAKVRAENRRKSLDTSGKKE